MPESSPVGRIAVENGVLVINGVAFETTPDVDGGDLDVVFTNCFSREPRFDRADFRSKGRLVVVGNVFGVSHTPRPRRWWRFW